MPDPTLQATALRYAANDLTPEELAAFEARLADDQEARDALAEAVRLSAQAIGQKPPAPHPSFRAAIRARLALGLTRWQQLAWAGVGAAAVAACTLIGLALAESAAPDAAGAPAPADSNPPRSAEDLAPAAPARDSDAQAAQSAPDEDDRSVAEIWADLSGHESVEKARDDELRWRQRVRDLCNPQHVSESVKTVNDVREP